ncbi:MAG: TlyA family rRNA (cytidine-2'-O)-methyltransferase [bacterium]|nr:TlyA family rRNA (cytidine-2'-O)-methyltransferase [bacterium]
MAKRRKSERFVSRGGDKLDGALDELKVEVSGKVSADLGANVGGFTDCLLQREAKCVYAVDTGYGVLAWKLRQDDRVVVLERTNALHVSLPEPVDLVVIDAGWTQLGRIVPHAVSLLKEGGIIVALLKPQYEAFKEELERGVVLAACLDDVVNRVVQNLQTAGTQVVGPVPSQVPGSGGNREFFILCEKG